MHVAECGGRALGYHAGVHVAGCGGCALGYHAGVHVAECGGCALGYHAGVHVAECGEHIVPLVTKLMKLCGTMGGGQASRTCSPSPMILTPCPYDPINGGQASRTCSPSPS